METQHYEFGGSNRPSPSQNEISRIEKQGFKVRIPRLSESIAEKIGGTQLRLRLRTDLFNQVCGEESHGFGKKSDIINAALEYFYETLDGRDRYDYIKRFDYPKHGELSD